MHSNDNARGGRPSIGIFQGRSVVLLVIGAGTFVGLFRILDAAGVDWPLSVAVSMLPLALCAVFVWHFANPHYIVRKAMAAGQLLRGPCEVCGDPRADVTWLQSFSDHAELDVARSSANRNEFYWLWRRSNNQI